MDSQDGQPPRIDARGVSGLLIGDGLQINVLASEPIPVRSAYLYQVRSIAPDRLHGREAELAELAEFCTRPGGSAYRWWRAKAWAGKSALLSWFVLHPPAGVHVVSFFVTARFAGQSDRDAFIDVVMEQLAALLGRPVPAHLTGATRAAHLLALLDDAATVCREQGSRLVLVVDGLDEDLGVTAGPDAYSIAALLPAHPPAGMRVIVAGRLAPPLPGDVPDHHPLREPAAVRLLEPSRDAAVIRDAAARELKRLLTGTPTEQDLLGLLTAAGGGLSVQDLVELTGTRDPWEISETLDTVSGRTFEQRPALVRHGPERPEHVYLLAHEDLQQEAVTFLAGDRLADYRRRLHNWVDGHRGRGWGAHTPGYLLLGYFRSLRADGDVPMMLGLALDPGRHAWLLDTTGGDATALAELTATREAVLAAASPNLPDLTKIALCRMRLSERNASLPLDVPVVWALLGRVGRARALAESMWSGSSARALAGVAREVAEAGNRTLAESIARSITEPDEGAKALSAVAAAAARDGDGHRAAELADAADRAARRIDNFLTRASCWATMARDAAAAGDRRRAAELVREIRALADDPEAAAGRWWLDGDLAEALAAAGEHGDALAVARAIDDPDRRAKALAAVARAVARSGDLTSAYRSAAEAEAAARAVSGVWLQPPMAAVIEAMAAAGAPDRAAELTAEAVVGLVDGSDDRPTFQVGGDLAVLTGAVARAGDHGRAEALARANPDAASKARALAAVAEAVVRSGDHRRGLELVSEAQEVARAVRSPVHHQVELAALAGVAARSGDLDWALAIAGTVHDPARAVAARRAVARAAANAGQCDRAEAIARAIDNVSGQRDAVLAIVAEAVLEAGAVERAVEIILTMETLRPRILAMAAMAGMREASGDRDDAIKLMDWLLAGIPEAGEDLNESSVLALAEVVADTGGVDQSERVARVIKDFALRARALAAVARAAARSGQVSRATVLVDEAEAVARSIGGPHDRGRTLASLIETINGTGDQEQVVVAVGGDRALARPVDGTSVRIRTLAVVTEAIAWIGDHGRAAALAAEIEDALEAAGSHKSDELLAGLARAAAETGQPERAEELADRITRPEIQARTLAHLANAADPGAAQRLTARAFAIDLWTAVDALHRLELDVLLLLAEDLGVAGLRTAPPGPVDPPPVRPASARSPRMRRTLRWNRRTSREP
ncbi:hypothetical protein [Streptomyces wuyuanensis]|uniref:Uncharacterized protein n=1 Tax=Streptomyces wuyuanensis TaxID=1196353 RepID=A0A1H0B2Z3_9ACTN|nr:hypothetical protein [Streptomyces wuyuanensis]SDN40017.1 hypothetical protein SAMN05444921_12622 [Streptomyces wuyuanensis]